MITIKRSCQHVHIQSLDVEDAVGKEIECLSDHVEVYGILSRVFRVGFWIGFAIVAFKVDVETTVLLVVIALVAYVCDRLEWRGVEKANDKVNAAFDAAQIAMEKEQAK